MTCNDVEPWLLATRSDTDLPVDFLQHLSRCEACSRLRERLGAIDGGVRALGEMNDRPALERLEATLNGVEQHRDPQSRSTHRWTYRVVGGIACVAFVALGWGLGYQTAKSNPPKAESVPVPNEANHTAGPDMQKPIAPPDSSAPASLIVRLASPAGKLAQETTAVGRASGLRTVADEVRTEALREAAAGRTAELSHLAEAHDRLIRYGLVAQTHGMPEPDRARIVLPLLADLARAEKEVALAVDRCPPAVGELISPLGKSLRDAGDAIRTNRPPSPLEPFTTGSPVYSLTALAVRASDANSPLRQADISADMTATLARGTVLLSLDGRGEDAAKLGPVLDNLLHHGVADNLDRVMATDREGKHSVEVSEIRTRASNAAGVLDRNLSKAPPAARPGLEKAIEASKHGRERAAEGGKGKSGKGPPWTRPDWTGKEPPGKSGLPPGFQKKQ